MAILGYIGKDTRPCVVTATDQSVEYRYCVVLGMLNSGFGADRAGRRWLSIMHLALTAIRLRTCDETPDQNAAPQCVIDTWMLRN
jgi:hypothetical protein